eukprot:TRINITY_DN22930_c0_g1_i1.p1 TRINITY_DN22930_c0_g1~~TRINITY_DN22930_c0_g1_i1.p1  ORF type:complete len:287 (+),score=32.21 TRINITY_DN22930_c0_g1_i1:48-908(+)
MTEFGKLTKLINELKQEIEIQGLTKSFKEKAFYDGCEDKIAKVVKTWEEGNCFARCKKLDEKLSAGVYGDGMQKKIANLSKDVRSLRKTILELKDWAALRTTQKIEQIPPALKGWRKCGTLEYTNQTAVFTPGEKWAGVLTIRGPKYSPYFGSDWNVSIDSLNGTITSEGTLGKVMFVRNIPWGTPPCLLTFTANICTLMSSPRSIKPAVHEGLVRSHVQGFVSTIAATRRLKTILLILLRMDTPTDLVYCMFHTYLGFSTSSYTTDLALQTTPSLMDVDRLTRVS